MGGGGLQEGRLGNEATDTQLPYDPRVTSHRSQLEPVLNVALSSPLSYRMFHRLVLTAALVAWAKH